MMPGPPDHSTTRQTPHPQTPNPAFPQPAICHPQPRTASPRIDAAPVQLHGVGRTELDLGIPHALLAIAALERDPGNRRHLERIEGLGF